MPKLILVRHAYASEPDPQLWPDDAKRPITPRKGAKKFRKAAQGISTLVKPDIVLSSPATRCIQTAALLESAGWPHARPISELDDNHTPKEVVEFIRALTEWPCTVALVGHGPNLEELLSYLVVGYGDNDKDVEKGGAALVTVSKKMKSGTGKLEWLMDEKELKHHR